LQRIRARPLHPDHRRDEPLGAGGAVGRPGPRTRRHPEAGGRGPPDRTGHGGRFRPLRNGREPAPDGPVRAGAQAGPDPLRPGPGRRPGRARRQPAVADGRHGQGTDALPAGRAADRYRCRRRAPRRPLVPERRAAPRAHGAGAARPAGRAGGGPPGHPDGGTTGFGIMPAMPTQPTLFEPDPSPPDDAGKRRTAPGDGAGPAAADAPVGPMLAGSEEPADDTAPAPGPEAPAAGGKAASRPPSLLADDAPPPAVAQLRERRPLWARLLGRLLRPW